MKPSGCWCANLMLLPGRVDLSAGLLLPRHLSGDPIIESIQEKLAKIWNKNERNSGVSQVSPIEGFFPLNECRPGAARIFEDRGRSKCPETIIRKKGRFMSFSCRNPINLTPNSPNSCGWRFQVSTFVASFTWELLCPGRDFQIHLDMHSLWFTYKTYIY